MAADAVTDQDAVRQAAVRARTKFIWELHPAIREFVLAVDELGRAIEARDITAVVKGWQTVAEREAEYLKVAAQ